MGMGCEGLMAYPKTAQAVLSGIETQPYRHDRHAFVGRGPPALVGLDETDHPPDYLGVVNCNELLVQLGGNDNPGGVGKLVKRHLLAGFVPLMAVRKPVEISKEWGFHKNDICSTKFSLLPDKISPGP